MSEFLSHSRISQKRFTDYFDSKDELLGVTICAGTVQLQASLRDLAEDVAVDPTRVLGACMDKLCSSMSQGFIPEGLGSEVLSYYPDDHPVHETAVACKRVLITLLEDLCCQASIENPARVAHQLLMIAEGSFTLRHFVGAKVSRKLGIHTAGCLIAAFPKQEGSR